jgi:hypothetical protein
VSDVLPNLLAVLCAVALVTALYALFRSLRAALVGETQVLADEALVTESRATLIAEKEALVSSLRDLASDHEAGKTSDEDLEHSNARLRGRALAVLRALEEEIAPYRAEAERMLELPAVIEVGASREEKPAKAKSEQTPATTYEAKVEVAPVEETKAEPAVADVPVTKAEKTCAACSAQNDEDAVFCKKCGKPIEQGAAS